MKKISTKTSEKHNNRLFKNIQMQRKIYKFFTFHFPYFFHFVKLLSAENFGYFLDIFRNSPLYVFEAKIKTFKTI